MEKPTDPETTSRTADWLHAEGELAELHGSLETLRLAVKLAEDRARAEPDSLSATFFLTGMRTALNIMSSPSSDPPDDLYDLALRITDETFGPGSYAAANAMHPDPRVQAAIRRAGGTA